MRRASWTTISSLARCTAWVTGLATGTDANPHWVLSASSDSGLYPVASAIRAATSASSSRRSDFVVSRPSTTTVPSRTSASGSKSPAGATRAAAPPGGEAGRAVGLRFGAGAEEGGVIAAESPIDVARLAANWQLDGTLVALVADGVVGEIRIDEASFGYGEIGMMVAAGWRGRGVGTALVAAAIDWARARELHKLTLSVFPHNNAAIALYRKFGFVQEGWRSKHIRRADGELWDLIEMGLPI